MAIPRYNLTTPPSPRPEGLIIIVGGFFGLKKKGLYSKKLMNGRDHLRNIPAELMSINSFSDLELLEVQRSSVFLPLVLIAFAHQRRLTSEI